MINLKSFNRLSAKKVLVLILGFSLVSRLLFLSKPENHYFDEIYHAFTAQVILHGDAKAWEWWNPHPEGFAYEWTHPPLAKEIMAASMFFAGENAWAWRLPAALTGTVAVYLVYLIGEELFDKQTGLFAAGILALDGLILVMSRIGMNDIYFVSFMLAAFLFFLRKKHFTAGFMLGLAGASKWTVLWFLPILALGHLSLKRKITTQYIWYFILPLLVYLASYLPLFATGHNFRIFWQMQQQMWWYHTSLTASHPFTSPAWSWPFLVRPIWLYTAFDPVKKEVANIYAQGNPLVFWGGLVTLLIATHEAFIKKNRELGLVIFAYLAFFVPWIASPRIMFLYHYLPSLPFLALFTGFVLDKYPKFILPFFTFALLLFFYFYPHWTGITVPVWLDNTYYWFGSWR